MENHPGRHPWLQKAQEYVGVAEIKGPHHHPKILEWWKAIHADFADDETPWCAAFVGGVLEECGFNSTRSAMARSYEKFGIDLAGPAVGAIVVFHRGNPEAGTGHVGFVVGRDNDGHLMVLGGNQGDKVCIKAFDTDRVVAYRWPHIYGLTNKPDESTLEELPLAQATDKRHYLSSDES